VVKKVEIHIQTHNLCNLYNIYNFYNHYNYRPFTNLAIPNAAAAARAPITKTLNAPDIAGWPVTLLLK
jgi:hypothetical protein